ncbi:MAG: hypothetical protein WCT16_01420 [Candidatus Buchananbacteria bacterium]
MDQKSVIYVFIDASNLWQAHKNNASEELKNGGDGYTDILKIENDIWGKKLTRRVENDN